MMPLLKDGRRRAVRDEVKILLMIMTHKGREVVGVGGKERFKFLKFKILRGSKFKKFVFFLKMEKHRGHDVIYRC